MPRTTSRVNRGVQVKATAAVKRARVEEAGLGGTRVGKSSATTRTAQARRDARADAAQRQSAPGTAAPSSSSPSSPSSAAAAKSSTKSKKPARRDAASRRGRNAPLIEVRAASSVKGSAGLDAFAEKVVTAALSRFLPRLTRIDVHLSDDNAAREGGRDKRCQIEAHPASQQPVSASATAATLEKALTTAANHMKRLLARRLAPHVRG